MWIQGIQLSLHLLEYTNKTKFRKCMLYLLKGCYITLYIIQINEINLFLKSHYELQLYEHTEAH